VVTEMLIAVDWPHLCDDALQVWRLLFMRSCHVLGSTSLWFFIHEQ